MNIETALTQRIGDAGKKLHTGRSRNDQVATDLRLYLRDAVDKAIELLADLQQVLLDIAEREAATIMPGFTHLQVAQPVTFGHHMLAWVEMLDRQPALTRWARADQRHAPGVRRIGRHQFYCGSRLHRTAVGF